MRNNYICRTLINGSFIQKTTNMRLFLLVALLSYPISAVFSQNDKAVDFSKVDKFALQVPDSVTTSVEKLAAYLTTTPMTATTERKVRAIYVWVSQNIAYDKDFDLASPFVTLDVIATQDADRVLAARKGVCMGYAHLFVALMESAGLKAEMVDGIIKQTDGNIPKMGHSWVAVRLRKKADKDAKTEPRWYLCDPTWASPASKADYGRINEKYFLAEPEDFIPDHLPLDPMWQLVEHPAPIEVFSKESDDKIKKYVAKSSKNPFIYQDTINRFLKMDSLKRLEKATWRMLHYNPINDYIWFEVGKVYSSHFTTYENKIGALLRNSIDASTILADAEKFDNMLNILRLYAATFKDCFNKIGDKTFAEQNNYYNDAYINALISAYRGGYQTVLLNNITQNNDEKTPRVLTIVQNINDKSDSTFSSARHTLKSLDLYRQRDIEMRLLYFDKITHERKAAFLFQYLEVARVKGMPSSEKSAMYNLLNLGRMHVRKYQESADSARRITLRTKGNTEADNLFMDTYSFFFDVEECALNVNFLSEDINNKREKGLSNDLIPYIQDLKDAATCARFVKEKGSKKSKIIETLIQGNDVFFKQIDGLNESKQGELYYLIAVSIWNENLDKDKALIKNDLTTYFNLSENSLSNAVGIYTELSKNKADERRAKTQIEYLESLKKEIVKLRKDFNL